MLALLTQRRQEVTWALLATVPPIRIAPPPPPAGVSENGGTVESIYIRDRCMYVYVQM